MPEETQCIRMRLLHVLTCLPVALRSWLTLFELSINPSSSCSLLPHGTRVDDVRVEVWVLQPLTVLWALICISTCRRRVFWIVLVLVKIILCNNDRLTITTLERKVLAKCKSRKAKITCLTRAIILAFGGFQFLPFPAFITGPPIFMNQNVLTHVVFRCS